MMSKALPTWSSRQGSKIGWSIFRITLCQSNMDKHGCKIPHFVQWFSKLEGRNLHLSGISQVAIFDDTGGFRGSFWRIPLIAPGQWLNIHIISVFLPISENLQMGFLLSPRVGCLAPIVLCPPGVFLRAKAEKAKVCCTPLPLRLYSTQIRCIFEGWWSHHVWEEHICSISHRIMTLCVS